MKKLIVALLFAVLSINSTSFAQTDKDEIRQLITDAPFDAALKKIEGEDIWIIGSWIMLLTAYGERQQAYQAAEKLKALGEPKNANDGYFFIAQGLASAGKFTEAIKVLHQFPVGDETDVQQTIVMFMASFSDSNNVIAQAQKIPTALERDEALQLAVEVFCSRREINQAQLLIQLFSTQQQKDWAGQYILVEAESAKIESENAANKPDKLPTLEALESTISTAMGETRERKQNEMFESIATDLAKHRDFKRARLIANQIINPLTRLSAYVEILSEYIYSINPALHKLEQSR
jgi:hypothetical protein